MANRYFRDHLVPDASTETDLYTVPDITTAVLRSLRVTNANASETSITVSEYDSGGSQRYLLKEYPLSPDGTIDVFNGVPCILEAGDKITVESSVATVHFYLSYLEVDRTQVSF
jgi:hypothetical protein